MKRKFDGFVPFTRKRPIQFLIGVALLYLLLVTLEIPIVFSGGFAAVTARSTRLLTEEDPQQRQAPTRPDKSVSNAHAPRPRTTTQNQRGIGIVSGLVLNDAAFDPSRKDGSSELYKLAKTAREVGLSLWGDIRSGRAVAAKPENRTGSCPGSVSLSGLNFSGVAALPCGLTLGSHVTVVGVAKAARPDYESKIAEVRDGDGPAMVSQFVVELQGLKTVEGEDPPRVFHFNPRLKGDWSGKPVIELNNRYRMQWGSALRCDGSKSRAEEDTGNEMS